MALQVNTFFDSSLRIVHEDDKRLSCCRIKSKTEEGEHVFFHFLIMTLQCISQSIPSPKSTALHSKSVPHPYFVAETTICIFSCFWYIRKGLFIPNNQVFSIKFLCNHRDCNINPIPYLISFFINFI